MTDQRYLDYINANKGKFSDEAIAEGLRKAGVPQTQIDEAFAEAARPPAPPAYVPPLRPEPPARLTEPSQAPVAPQQAAPAADAAAPQQTAPPFDMREVPGVMLKILTEPAVFFRQMPKKGGWTQPALFCAVMAVASAAISLAGVLLHMGMSLAQAGGVSAAGIYLTILLRGIVAWPIFLIVGLAVATLIAHVLWMILGSREDLETTFRCVAYLSAVAPVSSAARLVPFIGIWLGLLISLYGLYLFVHASVEVHGIARAKAMVVFVIFALLTAFMALISMAFWTYGRMLKSSPFASLFSSSGSTGQANGAAGLGPLLGAISAQQASRSPAGPVQGSASDQPANLPQAANQLMGALGANPNVQAVAGGDLKNLLPASVSGMRRVEFSNEKSGLGQMQFSTAKAVFRADSGSTITLSIGDTASFSKMMAAGWAMMDIDKETETGFERTLSYRGSKAHEIFDQKMRSGTFETVVQERFLVKAEGDGVDMPALQGAVDQIDFNALQLLGK